MSHRRDLHAIAALDDGVRSRLFDFVDRHDRAVTRDEAAAAAGISRKLAAFHLDKLVAAGLLRARYERPRGAARRVGRAPKVYEPSGVEFDVSIPARRYELLGELLLEAVTTCGAAEAPAVAAFRVARDFGLEAGRAVSAAARLGARVGPERALAAAEAHLFETGFAPHRARKGVLILRNCPFRALAQHAPDLVCGMNREYLEGLMRGLGSERVEAILAPHPVNCCVELRAG